MPAAAALLRKRLHRRPVRTLAIVSLSFSLAIVLAHVGIPETELPRIAAAVLLSGIAAVLAGFRWRDHQPVFLAALLLLSLGTGLLWSYVHILRTRVGLSLWADMAEPVRTWFDAQAEDMSHLVRHLFSDDVSAFLQALMLGQKEDLYQAEELYRTLQRAGILHMVAVSGLHVSFVVGTLQMVFGHSRRFSLIALVLVWLFVFLTGANASAVRAGVMQTLLLLAPLVNRENDSPTSLSFALALLLAVDPDAWSDLGLQLSFGAMGGLLLFGGRWNRDILKRLPLDRLPAMLRRLTVYIVSTGVSSLAVLVFTVPVMIANFGYVSLASPLANLLSIWAVPWCFGGGWLALGLELWQPALARAIAPAVGLLVRLILKAAELTAGGRLALVYFSDKLSLLWAGLIYAVGLVCLVSRMPSARTVTVLVLAAAVTFPVLRAGERLEYRTGTTFAVLDVGQGQSLCFLTPRETFLVDCGNTGMGHISSAWQVEAYLQKTGRDHIDVLFLTHLHTDHVSGVPELLRTVPVENLVLYDDLEDELGWEEEIRAAAAETGCKVCTVTRDEQISYPNALVELFAPEAGGDANERCLCLKVTLGTLKVLITGDSPASLESAIGRKAGDVDVLIVGHHGSRFSTSEELLQAVTPEMAVISTGTNTYGHPTFETLQRLYRCCGEQVFRTDCNGTIEIRTAG